MKSGQAVRQELPELTPAVLLAAPLSFDEYTKRMDYYVQRVVNRRLRYYRSGCSAIERDDLLQDALRRLWQAYRRGVSRLYCQECAHYCKKSNCCPEHARESRPRGKRLTADDICRMGTAAIARFHKTTDLDNAGLGADDNGTEPDGRKRLRVVRRERQVSLPNGTTDAYQSPLDMSQRTFVPGEDADPLNRLLVRQAAEQATNALSPQERQAMQELYSASAARIHLDEGDIKYLADAMKTVISAVENAFTPPPVGYSPMTGRNNGNNPQEGTKVNETVMSPDAETTTPAPAPEVQAATKPAAKKAAAPKKAAAKPAKAAKKAESKAAPKPAEKPAHKPGDEVTYLGGSRATWLAKGTKVTVKRVRITRKGLVRYRVRTSGKEPRTTTLSAKFLK